MTRGRPAVRRAQVLTYWRKHGPCSLGQIVRATGVERSRLCRIMKQLRESGEVEFRQGAEPENA
jgi:DNA-binding MarR family transcriptional regulator